MRHSGLIGLALLVLTLPLAADRIQTSGFETNNTTETEWGATGSPATATSPVHSGTYSLELTNTVQKYVNRSFTAATSGTFYARLYFYVKTGFGSSASYQALIMYLGAADSCRADFNPTDQKFRVFNTITSTAVNMSGTLSVNTWYRLELRMLISDTVGECELRIYSGDSTTELETLSITNEDTLSTSMSSIRFGNIGAVNWASGNAYMDDIALNKNSGTFQTSWPGPGKIALLETASDNSVAWTGVTGGCGTHSDCVDDEPGTPDDATTYISEATTLNLVDRLNVGSLPAEVTSDADMILFDAYARVGSTQTSTTGMRLKIWDEGGNLTNGPTINANVNGWKIVSTAEHQPYDLGARTKANVEAFDLGYENITDTATRERRVTAIWANVEWIEAAAGAAAVPPRRVIVLE